MCDEIRLVRYDLGDTPWGFRITGGRDFGTPLLIVKVIGGSIAALAGVQVGDLVRGINYVPTNDFTHMDAQRAILESGDTLILNLLKAGEYELQEPPEIPVIDIQSPEDKEVEEIGRQEPEDLEMSFMIKLDRSGRISAVEEIPTPNTSPRSSPTPRTTSSSSGSEKRRKSSASSSHSEKVMTNGEAAQSERKPRVSVTVGDGPINLQQSTNEVSTKKSKEKRDSVSQQEVTLHEELRVETSLKKTTTEIKERSEEEFITGVRGEIMGRAHDEKRELTDDEIAEMMAGEAEVLEGQKGKEVIGVNFQKFLPKCDFIKDSEVFKVLQEEQTKKEKSEEQQLEKDPLKRFSKFLIKPKTETPLPKPKPLQTAPMPWQLKLNGAQEASVAKTQQISTVEKTNEAEKASKQLLSAEQEVKTEITEVESQSETITVSSLQESEEKLTLKIKHEKEEFNEEVIRQRESETEVEEIEKEAESVNRNGQEPRKPSASEDELENIDWDNKKEKKRKESDELYTCPKRNSSEESRKSKTKKVAFVGLDFKETIEKQLAEIQKELLTLQQLPIEIQDHLLNVQRTLQDIVAQRSQMQVGCR